MGMEMSSIWEAMKSSQYQRTLDQLEVQMANATNLTDALNITLNRVVMVTHAVAGTFWVHDMFGDGRIHPKAVYDNQSLMEFSLAPGEGIAGQVIQSGRSVIIADCQKHPQWSNRADAKTGFQTRTMICVPMRFREFVFGCIQIINKKDDLPFDDKDLAFAENLAAYSTRLFEKLHFLDTFAATSKEQPVEVIESSKEHSFAELLSMENFADIEEELLHTGRVASLSPSQQKNVLRLSREIWKILSTQELQEKQKSGFWKF